MLDARTTVIDAKMVKLDKKEKRILIDKNAYLFHLSRYIHRNPVAAGLVSHPADWAFSSYRDYVGLRKGTLPKPAVVLKQFASVAAYAAYVEEGDDRHGQIGHLLFDE